MGFVWGVCPHIFRKWNPEVWTPGFQLLGVIACAPSLSAGVDLPSFPLPARRLPRASLHPSPVYTAPQPGPDCSVSSAGLAGICQQVLRGENSVRLVIGDVNLEPHSEDAQVTLPWRRLLPFAVKKQPAGRCLEATRAG